MTFRIARRAAARVTIFRVEIRWPRPSGRVERFADLAVDGYVRIIDSKGVVYQSGAVDGLGDAIRGPCRCFHPPVQIVGVGAHEMNPAVRLDEHRPEPGQLARCV